MGNSYGGAGEASYGARWQARRHIDAVRLVDGEKAPLRAVKDVKGGGHTGAMTGAMVGTAVVFFPAAPLFLFMHARTLRFRKEPRSRLTLAVTRG